METDSPHKWHNNNKMALRSMDFGEVYLNRIVIVSSGGLPALTVMKFWNFCIVEYRLLSDILFSRKSVRSLKKIDAVSYF